MKRILLIITILLSINIFASTGIHLEPANNDVHNQKSLQNGAKLYINYCMGCHSIKFMRFNRIADDLNISLNDVEKNFIWTGVKVGQPVKSSIDAQASKKWFGNTPPDLSLTARSRGTDWLFTYLKGFYKDESRPFGVNNHALKGVAMPDVLWKMKQDSTVAEFNSQVRDIVNFLDYVGEPIKIKRTQMGIKVLLFLLVLFILSYLLKKEYWKDVKYGKWRRRD
ncbi:ubiquinol cytochrome C oxidoreductase, cytochrome C1 subunit [hydrothermal vent metagenome]|uniref:Ubiquinol cytochrome C oxidoreductase, cytochrome C1 subunit n=1 Tax=hydrothermal vent metagenome TaxID=652676 RepID=A0A1W1CT88_9ZZZZ